MLHVFYNEIVRGGNEGTCKHMPLNNLDLMNSWLKQCCAKDAISIKAQRDELQLSDTEEDRRYKLIFGGRKNYIKRLKGKISKESLKN